eukprot:COSAG01_NODE_6111_length_3844_cov_2.941255_3_plen_586_part_00
MRDDPVLDGQCAGGGIDRGREQSEQLRLVRAERQLYSEQVLELQQQAAAKTKLATAAAAAAGMASAATGGGDLTAVPNGQAKPGKAVPSVKPPAPSGTPRPWSKKGTSRLAEAASRVLLAAGGDRPAAAAVATACTQTDFGQQAGGGAAVETQAGGDAEEAESSPAGSADGGGGVDEAGVDGAGSDGARRRQSQRAAELEAEVASLGAQLAAAEEARAAAVSTAVAQLTKTPRAQLTNTPPSGGAGQESGLAGCRAGAKRVALAKRESDAAVAELQGQVDDLRRAALERAEQEATTARAGESSGGGDTCVDGQPRRQLPLTEVTSAQSNAQCTPARKPAVDGKGDLTAGINTAETVAALRQHLHTLDQQLSAELEARQQSESAVQELLGAARSAASQAEQQQSYLEEMAAQQDELEAAYGYALATAEAEKAARRAAETRLGAALRLHQAAMQRTTAAAAMGGDDVTLSTETEAHEGLHPSGMFHRDQPEQQQGYQQYGPESPERQSVYSDDEYAGDGDQGECNTRFPTVGEKALGWAGGGLADMRGGSCTQVYRRSTCTERHLMRLRWRSRCAAVFFRLSARGPV